MGIGIGQKVFYCSGKIFDNTLRVCADDFSPDVFIEIRIFDFSEFVVDIGVLIQIQKGI